MSTDWVDDLPHDAPLLAAMAAARRRRSEVLGESTLTALLADAWDEGARAATLDYGVGEARNPYREKAP